MTNKFPKISKDQLIHPKAEKRSKFNGDKRWENQGFDSKRQFQGLTVVHGSRPPSGLKHPVNAPPLSRDLEPLQPLYDNLEPSPAPSIEPLAAIEKPAVYQRKAFDSSKSSEKVRDENKSHWRHIFDNGGGD